MSRFLFIVFGLFASLASQAQQNTSAYYSFPETLPEEYQFDADYEYNKLLLQLRKEIPNKAHLKLFAEQVVYTKKDLLDRGHVYLGWEQMEAYLNQLLNTILPDSLRDFELMHIYPSRNAAVNAFTLYDGSIFINIGALAAADDEAAIAIMIGHEVGHFLNKDAPREFTKAMQTKASEGHQLQGAASHDDLAVELKADSIAYLLASKAGYTLTSAIQNLKQLRHSNNYQPGATPQIAGNYFTGQSYTNDVYNKRLAYLNQCIKALPQGKKQRVSSKKFYTLKQQAKKEALYWLLSEQQYRACLQQAFTYHLFEPQNSTYIYYTLEGIRRLTFGDKRKRGKGFLTDHMSRNKTFGRKDGILKDLSFLIDTSRLASIKATELLAKPYPFQTYDQAFKYFSKLANRTRIHESLLTQALYKGKKKAEWKSLLTQYISSGSPKYIDYARYLQKDDLGYAYDGSSNDLMVVAPIEMLEQSSHGFYRLYRKETKAQQSYVKAITQLMEHKFPEYAVVGLSALGEEDFSQAIYYTKILAIGKALLRKHEEGQRSRNQQKANAYAQINLQSDLMLLEPEFWYWFIDGDFKSLSFVGVSATDLAPSATRWQRYINPANWLQSNRHQYELTFFSYVPENTRKPVTIHQHKVAYKLNRGHLLNSIYQAVAAHEAARLAAQQSGR